MTEAKCSECDRLIEELDNIRTSAGELEDLLYKRLTELRDEVRELKAENKTLKKENEEFKAAEELRIRQQVWWR